MTPVLTAFDRAMSFVSPWEGGISRDPTDRAAKKSRSPIHTVAGITQETYDDWRLRKGDLPRPVAEIEADEIGAIYRHQYWREAWCDRVADDLKAESLALCLFDGAVQHGVSGSTRLWQRTVHAEADGVPGPKTLEQTARRIEGYGELPVCEAYLDRRVGIYADLIKRYPDQRKYRNGWRNRVNALCKAIGVSPVWEGDE